MSDASPFPRDLTFVHEWRAYQSRVLSELEPHLADGHLHIVAAPGAGKTILGLEVVRRLGKPALVVTPTVTIRNQWIDRFANAFQSEGNRHRALIGHRLEASTAIAVTTYQALHASAKSHAAGGSEWGAAPAIGTLVLDEAHHLRNEWWKVLIDLRERNPDITILALTATPPFDVSVAEWNRYITLCGPIDAEISVPELVAARNLCPHQDYIYLSEPTPTEWQGISAYRAGIEALESELAASPKLARAVLGNPRFANFDVEPHREAVLANPELFSAMLVYLCAAGHGCEAQRDFLGVQDSRVPTLNAHWLEILLTDFLFEQPDLYDADEAYRREVLRALHRAYAIERKRIDLAGGRRLLRTLSASDTKIASVERVFGLERKAMGDALRLVVLTDHVRKEYLGASDDNGSPMRLGAVPIFESLRTDRSHDVALCLLTGGLIIIPRTAEEGFIEALAAAGIEPPRHIPHPVDERYVLMNVTDGLRQGAVQAATQLFNAGAIRVIVGTAALLAEGWDAQAANTLIIASAVSSHVLSNQMRGRVIRVDGNKPDKVSNIWHLACVEPGASDGGGDFAMLERRFGAFEGVSYDGRIIESGFSRLFELPARWSREDVERLNADTLGLANQRAALARAWREALGPETQTRQRGIVDRLRAIGEIDRGALDAQIKRLESGGSQAPSELTDLRTRVALQTDRISELETMIGANESAITALIGTSAAVAGMRDLDRGDGSSLDLIIGDLERLTERAKLD